MDTIGHVMAVTYICWNCGGDFDVAERDGLTNSLEVTCPACGSDLVAVDFAAVRRGVVRSGGAKVPPADRTARHEPPRLVEVRAAEETA